MRILEIARSSEHLTPGELAEALEEAEAAAGDEAAALDALPRRRDGLVGGPEDRAADALDVEVRTRRVRLSVMEGVILEVQKRYQAVTRWQPRQRPGSVR
jgi:hypothetical protein